MTRVVYRKFDGALHWNYTAEPLGSDDHGTWLGSRPDTPLRMGERPPALVPQATVLLVPSGSWWTALFNAEPERTEVYCDITTPASWLPDEVTILDLDLDVRRRRDGTIQLLDEDEFADHQVRYGYPPDVVTNARAAADWLVGALGDGSEPFASAYRGWLAKVMS